MEGIKWYLVLAEIIAIDLIFVVTSQASCSYPLHAIMELKYFDVW